MILATGQTACFDAAGQEISCAGGGQDGAHRRGLAWPVPRFSPAGPGLVTDHLTGLTWSQDANPAQFPLAWPEALDYVAGLNAERHRGRADWRLPNRRELFSLISFADRVPALPAGHPFANVQRAWYWTSTTAALAPEHAWYVHTEGGRMFYGLKTQYFMVWPLCGPASAVLPATGQTACFDAAGRRQDPADAPGQDGADPRGAVWPRPRFAPAGEGVVADRLTGLVWTAGADLAPGPVSWTEALALVMRLNQDRHAGRADWRLPNIRELESLVDASRHHPALPAGHPFAQVGEAYWSATSSAFEPDWAMALYLHKGAVGVGQKPGRHFLAWACADA